jgi:hypothetical protein
VEAGGRRHRRKRRHHPGGNKRQRKGKHKGKQKGQHKGPHQQTPSPPPPSPPCMPEPQPTTCAGRCGTITNTCGEAIDCGPCSCETCQAGPSCCGTACVDLQGDQHNCGSCGHRCTTGEICRNRQCVSSCTPTTCTAEGTECGTIADGCGGILQCGSCGLCQMCNSAGQCVADPVQNRTTCDGSGTAISVCCNGACCAGCCDGDGACGACRVFVTSQKYDGNLKGSSASGLAGADDKCQQLAGSVNPPLPGTYQAWLSDSTESPSTRFRCTQASCSTHGYVLVDGTTVVATDWADLTTCEPGNGPCLAHAITVTEQGGGIGSQNNVWTHTTTAGTPGGGNASGSVGNVHCLDWSTNDPSQSGDFAIPAASGTGDASWTLYGSEPCGPFNVGGGVGVRLYCFQQS